MNYINLFNSLFPVYKQVGANNRNTIFLFISIVFIFFMHLFETYLSYRQYRTYFNKDPPKVYQKNTFYRK